MNVNAYVRFILYKKVNLIYIQGWSADLKNNIELLEMRQVYS